MVMMLQLHGRDPAINAPCGVGKHPKPRERTRRQGKAQKTSPPTLSGKAKNMKNNTKRKDFSLFPFTISLFFRTFAPPLRVNGTFQTY